MNALTRLVMPLTAMVLLGQPIEAQSQRPLMYATRQCNEYAIELHLDPRRFQDFVGPGLSGALVEGKARVVIVVHDWSQLWIDGHTSALRRKSASGSWSGASTTYDPWSERSRQPQRRPGLLYLQ